MDTFPQTPVWPFRFYSIESILSNELILIVSLIFQHTILLLFNFYVFKILASMTSDLSHRRPAKVLLRWTKFTSPHKKLIFVAIATATGTGAGTSSHQSIIFAAIATIGSEQVKT